MDKLIKHIPPAQIRNELQAMVIKDLLGPAGGDAEEIAEPSVRGRYLVGALAPKNQSRPQPRAALLSEEEDLSGSQSELATAGADDEDGQTDSDLPVSISMLPSAIGFTFSVTGEAKALQFTAGWGHYQRGESQYLEKKDGSPRRVWQRIPVRRRQDYL